MFNLSLRSRRTSIHRLVEDDLYEAQRTRLEALRQAEYYTALAKAMQSRIDRLEPMLALTIKEGTEK